MKVYRLEGPNGLGPFHSEQRKVLQLLQEYGVYKKPTPPFDGMKSEEDIEQTYYFGCPSFRQFNSWFPAALRHRLRIFGFRLVVYRIPSELVLMGYTQVAFPKSAAEVIVGDNHDRASDRLRRSYAQVDCGFEWWATTRPSPKSCPNARRKDARTGSVQGGMYSARILPALARDGGHSGGERSAEVYPFPRAACA